MLLCSYFNPPLELQKTYIKQIADDLGTNFGREKDGGFGGDIEVFAVRGKHLTEWHFDAQEVRARGRAVRAELKHERKKLRTLNRATGTTLYT